MTLEQILTQVAAGTLSVEDAARLIRRGPPRPPPNRRPPLGAVLLLAAAGIVFLGIGGCMGVSSSRFAAGAARAEGTVIQMVRGNKGNTSPVVRFVVDGKTHEFQSRIASSPPAYTVGEVVTVLFPPGHPDQGQIDSFTEQWLMPLIFFGVGVVLTVIAICVWVTRQRRGPPPSRLAAPPGVERSP